VRSHPTAGQASIEYLGAIALVALVFILAAPAVGAPSVAGAVVREFKHALCIVTGDICTPGDAARVGLAPCPLGSRTTGFDVSGSFLIAELGGKWLLAVTPLSDGTVSVVRTASVSGGLSAGGIGGNIGPVRLEGGPEGTIQARVQPAFGWVFPDRVTAGRFLEHATRNALDFKRWPTTWQSGELGIEGVGSVKGKAEIGRGGGRLIGGSGSAQAAVGVKHSRDGSLTTYSRMTLERGEVVVPYRTPLFSAGRNDWIVELTRDKGGRFRELVLRDATISLGGKRVTETVARLDLRDPGNLEAARPFLASTVPWTVPGGGTKQAILDRIASHGVVERLTSTVEDRSRGFSASIKFGIKLSLGGKKIKIMRRLVEATAIVGGGLTGKRLDCLPGTAPP
jgi:hypothetical protein